MQTPAVTGAVSNNLHSKNLKKERSILSIVFFDSEITWLEENILQDEVLQFQRMEWNQELEGDSFENLDNSLDLQVGNPEKSIASLANDQYCLVPDLVFEPKLAEQYLKKNTGIKIAGTIEYQRIPSLNCWCCFSLDHRLDMFLQNRFPGLQITHEAVVLIEYLMQQSESEKQLFVWNHQRLIILIKGNGKLLHFNSYKAENIEEVLYYISNVRKSLDLEVQGPMKLNTNNKVIMNNKILAYFPQLELRNVHNFHQYFSLFKTHLCA